MHLKVLKKIDPFNEQDTKLAAGKLGTLHWADKVGNTPAWQNRMKKIKKVNAFMTLVKI